jgi:hypothetical protein
VRSQACGRRRKPSLPALRRRRNPLFRDEPSSILPADR